MQRWVHITQERHRGTSVSIVAPYSFTCTLLQPYTLLVIFYLKNNNENKTESEKSIRDTE